jgi:hypothetical protein
MQCKPDINFCGFLLKFHDSYKVLYPGGFIQFSYRMYTYSERNAHVLNSHIQKLFDLHEIKPLLKYLTVISSVRV